MDTRTNLDGASGFGHVLSVQVLRYCLLNPRSIADGAECSVKILESVAGPSGTIKFIDQVVRYAPSSLDFRFFSWSEALVGDYDVFHVHWPEFLIRSRRMPVAFIRRTLFSLLLRRIRRRGTRVVRTLHNISPHESGGIRETRLLARLDALTTDWVTLTECSQPPITGARTVIPHGDYREQFEQFSKRKPHPRRFVFFGRIEPYKGIDELLDVFEEFGASGDELRIVGLPTPEMRAIIEERVEGWRNPGVNVSVRLAYVSDEDMVRELTDAEAVILPYREMHNSGVALVALSLDRPIIVPKGCVNDSLSRECGPGWVAQFGGTFNADALRVATDHLRADRSESPTLPGRSWHEVASAYARVFLNRA